MTSFTQCQAYIRCVSAVNGNWLDPLLARLKQADVARLSHDPRAVAADPDRVVRRLSRAP